MLSPEQERFLIDMFHAAQAASHIFPDAAAAEAAVETGWGRSGLFLKANNVFGQKQSYAEPIFETVTMPTEEWEDGQLIHVQAEFVKFPTIQDAFATRMATLRRLALVYPEYAAALQAQAPEAYLAAVSLRWSTDPRRALKCTQILTNHANLFTAQEEA